MSCFGCTANNAVAVSRWVGAGAVLHMPCLTWLVCLQDVLPFLKPYAEGMADWGPSPPDRPVVQRIPGFSVLSRSFTSKPDRMQWQRLIAELQRNPWQQLMHISDFGKGIDEYPE